MRVKRKISRGKICAELEENHRNDRIVDTLSEIDFYNYNSDSKEISVIVVAVLKEWAGEKGMAIDEVVRRVRQVLVLGSLRALQERGELEVSRDSYGRQIYRRRM